MKRSREKEMMDLPGNPAHLLEEDLNNLRLLNRTLGAYRGVLRVLEHLAGVGGSSRFSLLDVGTGSADIPVAIVRWAKGKGIAVRIVALEPEPITAAMARRLTRDVPEISVVRGDALHPPF
ncbi:MAG: SAM-dependent methyltransferase, partial [Candidatus Binatota bacterium]